MNIVLHEPALPINIGMGQLDGATLVPEFMVIRYAPARFIAGIGWAWIV
jgi:hypothetical protein